MEKLFTVAGTSRRNGTVKFRFSNDLKGRIPMLVRTGHTEINLVELPEAMTKASAIQFLATVGIRIDHTTPVAEPTAPTEPTLLTVVTLRSELEADGEPAEDMTEQFLAEVVARENQ
jgi:hypothetical protein